MDFTVISESPLYQVIAYRQAMLARIVEPNVEVKFQAWLLMTNCFNDDNYNLGDIRIKITL